LVSSVRPFCSHCESFVWPSIIDGRLTFYDSNALITPSEYFRSVLIGTPQESSFLSWFIAVYNISCIVFGAHATASMSRVSTSASASIHISNALISLQASVGRRILYSEAIIFGILLLTTILVSTSNESDVQTSPSSSAFPLMIGLTLVVAAATSYLQLAVVTLANAYGPSCMGTMLSGQGFVGATISLVQLTAAISSSSRSDQLASQPEDGKAARRAAIEFFATTTVLMLFAIVVFIALQRSNVYRDMRMKMDGEKQASAIVDERTAPELAESSSNAEQHQLSSVTGIKRYMNVDLQRQMTFLLSTQKKVLTATFSIAYIFIITLAVFPALTARVQSTGTNISPIIFVALHFFIFNLGDLAGRSCPSLLPRIFLFRRIKIIAFLCFLRTAFVPLLGYCNISSSTTIPSASISSSMIFGDVPFFFLMLLLGVSNGLLATSIFVTGPHQENLTLPSEQALAAGLLTWWLSIGLAIGSLLSFVVGPSF
jgi:equilibrative nucleoside transporter 1/2/3